MAGIKNMEIANVKRGKIWDLLSQGIRPKAVADRLKVSPSLVTKYSKEVLEGEYFINDRCPITGFKENK